MRTLDRIGSGWIMWESCSPECLGADSSTKKAEVLAAQAVAADVGQLVDHMPLDLDQPERTDRGRRCGSGLHPVFEDCFYEESRVIYGFTVHLLVEQLPHRPAGLQPVFIVTHGFAQHLGSVDPEMHRHFPEHVMVPLRVQAPTLGLGEITSMLLFSSTVASINPIASRSSIAIPPARST